MSRLRHPGVLAGLGVLLWAIASWQRPELLESLERWSYDRRFELRGPLPSRGEVAIVGIDDATHSEAPELFTRRAGMARLITALREAEASVIGLDLFFSEPESLLGPELAAEIEALVPREPEPIAQLAEEDPAWALLRKISVLLSGDATLSATLKDRPDVVLALHLGRRGRAEIDPRALRRGTYGQFGSGTSAHENAEQVMASMPLFARAAVGVGTINIEEDPDKIVRALPAVSFHGDRPFAPLSLQVLARHQGFGRGGLAYTAEPPTVSWGEQSALLDAEGRLLLNFRGRQSYPFYSALELVEGRLPPDTLKGKMVLVGVTYLGHDVLHTALDRGLPGVFFHAEAIDNFLVGDFLQRSGPRTDGLVALGLGLMVVLLFLPALRLSPVLRIGLTLGLLLAYLGLAQWLFVHQGKWIAILGPGLAAGTALAVGLASGWLREGRQRRRLRHTFAHYLAPAVISDLLAHPEALTPGGARRELTVLFSDIRSFTTLSEDHSPEEVVAFLGRYLEPMTGAVLDAGGLLDKYIGDAIMAVFGAPVLSETHPRQSLEAVLAMHRALEQIRARERGAFAKLAIGVGVNTGEMIVGNMGSATRFDYTVVGDAVNLASRLESLTKTYGVFCLCGEATHAAAPEDFSFREVDRVRVKGKEQPVSIFELLEGPGRTVASYESLPTFVEALAAWRAGELGAARKAFGEFAAANPKDPVAALYLSRLELMGDSVPADWNGVFTFSEK